MGLDQSERACQLGRLDDRLLLASIDRHPVDTARRLSMRRKARRAVVEPLASADSRDGADENRVSDRSLSEGSRRVEYCGFVQAPFPARLDLIYVPRRVISSKSLHRACI